MTARNDALLHVAGRKLVNGCGQEVRLRGVTLGSWMNIENFQLGLPGIAQGMRQAFHEALGDTGDLFFRRFLHDSVGEDDFAHLRMLGANIVRLPLNYRHFEDDLRPFQYKAEGLRQLDRVVAFCRKNQIYFILDLHAAQGWQNYDWHSDNPYGGVLLYSDALYQERVGRLWQHLAQHYRNEPWLAGYDLINEPTAERPVELSRFYEKMVSMIREVDRDHIVWLEGNWFGTKWEGIKLLRDPNVAYSFHYYPGVPIQCKYPGIYKGTRYDRQKMIRDIKQHLVFFEKSNRPMWLGETGIGYLGIKDMNARVRILDDLMGMCNEAGFHYAIWSYKDVGAMGLLYPKISTPYQRFIGRKRYENTIRTLHGKVSLRSYKYARKLLGLNPYEPFDWSIRPHTDRLAWGWQYNRLKEEIKDLSRADILEMSASWRFENCAMHKEALDVFQQRCSEPVDSGPKDSRR